MKRMLLSLALLLVLVPGVGTAEKEGAVREKGANSEANFERAKARKIEDLKTLLACVEAATSREMMKGCREQVGKRRETEEKRVKLQKLQEQKQRLEERERKLQSEAAK
ncbi:hypothetical protein [Candidatus Magnetaquicoccus inordinatus]|uniref:hypothetical protein n=1 Tax=Candidatus Magnetaquicoccus inordinatus TaxID=2496818 RepID=UPI00102AA580|nr:hypothetical protein [Candidatus Magnetaquicoccus inordinatus]